MLALQHSKQPPDKCSINVLPCRINYNGPSKVTKRFWSPSLEKDKSTTAYFRGRKLRGRLVKVPRGYGGIVANPTDRLLANDLAKTRPASLEESALEDLDDKADVAEPVKILETVATFDEVTIWGHDKLPPVDDIFVKGIEEWIAFAQAIHSTSATENASDYKPMDSSVSCSGLCG